MFYIGYLRSLKQNELIDYRDKYVKKCIDEESLHWFPCYQDFIADKNRGDHKQKNRDRQLRQAFDLFESNLRTSMEDHNKLMSDQIQALRDESLQASLKANISLKKDLDTLQQDIKSSFRSQIKDIKKNIRMIEQNAKLDFYSDMVSDPS